MLILSSSIFNGSNHSSVGLRLGDKALRDHCIFVELRILVWLKKRRVLLKQKELQIQYSAGNILQRQYFQIPNLRQLLLLEMSDKVSLQRLLHLKKRQDEADPQRQQKASKDMTEVFMDILRDDINGLLLSDGPVIEITFERHEVSTNLLSYLLMMGLDIAKF